MIHPFGFLDSDPFIRPLTWQMILARVTEEVSEWWIALSLRPIEWALTLQTHTRGINSHKHRAIWSQSQ